MEASGNITTGKLPFSPVLHIFIILKILSVVAFCSTDVFLNSCHEHSRGSVVSDFCTSYMLYILLLIRTDVELHEPTECKVPNWNQVYEALPKRAGVGRFVFPEGSPGCGVEKGMEGARVGVMRPRVQDLVLS